MITQLVDDGGQIKAVLDNVVASITAVLLQIISGIFAEFFSAFDLLIGGNFFDNPAPLLIGLLFMLTAWKIHTAGLL